MIKHPAFAIEEWGIHEIELHLDDLPQTESIFALSNGHIGLRGNLDEGEPHGLPGTYLNSVYELSPLPYAEAGYGYPESGQFIANVTNGKLIRLLVDDEPFDVRYGEIESHDRELDFRAGVLRRHVRWTSPAGQSIQVSSVRMVSFTQRAVAAICYEVEPIGAPARIVVQSELVANESLEASGGDPRAGKVLETSLECVDHQAKGTMGLMVHYTKVSGLHIGAAMDHQIRGPKEMTVEAESYPDVARVTIAARLKPGERLRIIKFFTYGWSSQRSRPALHDQVIAALSAARLTGWEGLLAEQRAYLDDFWRHANVEIEGDPEIQQAVRFALYHTLQAGARAERRPIPAKGLTGSGYDGHVFWDMDTFVLPVLTLTVPRAAADALRWRHSTLGKAKERAHQLGLKGAAFPWRTIAGEECSSYWPAGTAAFHVNADIAYAVVNYIGSTEDVAFEETVGLELLVETARLWRSLGYLDEIGQFRIDGVTGPDEYSAIADNNVYTNLMAKHNLYCAAEAIRRYPHVAQRLGVDDSEADSWHEASEKMFIPYDERLGVTPQAEAFTEHEVWDFASTPPDKYPLLLHFPYFDLYRKQVIKQADLVLAMQLCTDEFTLEQKARNFAYYEPLTVRDSSLSANTQAVIAAEVGQLELAYDYLAEAAFMDLKDLQHNTRNGLHIASLAGTWTALVAGFGGMRAHDGTISFAPQLPEAITHLTFHVTSRSRLIRVEVATTQATYYLLEGLPLKTWHHGDEIALSVGKAVTRPIFPVQAGPRPTQPPGCSPIPRREHRV